MDQDENRSRVKRDALTTVVLAPAWSWDDPQPSAANPQNTEALSPNVPCQQPTVTLGHDTETGEPLHLGDFERRGGLYVLGRSGTGKSTLLLNTIDQDLKNGHGVFFLDPHGDAITELLNDGPLHRLRNDLILLDPKDRTHSFGINLLACSDVTNMEERHTTYTRAYEVFRKIWEQEWEERPWLQLIVQYVIYVFIENPDYTLADAPRFLTDHAFRNHLLSNVTHHWEARDFWHFTFQPKQAEAALTRLYRLLGDPYVKHIVAQRRTTIDFAEMMQQRRMVCVRLSASLPSDSRKFIGTIVLSELLRAVQSREHIPPDERHQFCIFIDEFQNFASYEDVSILYTQARKFGIATTVVHQERYGQFGENKAILGATDAAANKVFFQLTVRDAQEQAPEFAKPPPTETRLERELILSQNPVADLLWGHKNPQIREFVNRHLRPVQERIADLRELMERERLVRMETA